jgi:hypothetical protein
MTTQRVRIKTLRRKIANATTKHYDQPSFDARGEELERK